MSPVVIIGLAIGIFFIVGAGLTLLTGGGSRVDEQRLEEFVGSYGDVDTYEPAELAPRPDMAARMDKALQNRGFFAPIKKRIATADVKLRVSEYVALQLIVAIGIGAITYFIFGLNLVLVAVLSIVGLRLPRMYINFMANRRLQSFDRQLSDTLNLWVNALRSGYSVLQGMEAIATELPPPVSKEFERVVQEVRLGLSLEQALANMLRRVPSEDLDLVITAVNIQREVGGNLAEILDIISFTIRERVRIKGEIRTLTAQGRLTGWVISLLPIGLALALYSINPEYGGQLFVKAEPWIWPGVVPCGWVVIGIGLLMMAMGVVAIGKIVDIEV